MRKKIISMIAVITLLATMIPTVSLGAVAGAIASGGHISGIYIYAEDDNGDYTFTDETKGTLKGHISQVAAEVGDRVVILGDPTKIYWCGNGASNPATPTINIHETEGTIDWYGYGMNKSSTLWIREGKVTQINDNVYADRNLDYNISVSQVMTYNSRTYTVFIGNITIALDNPRKLAEFDIDKIKTIRTPIVAGGRCSWFYDRNGNVYMLGFAHGNVEAQEVSNQGRIDEISVGEEHSLFLYKNGKVYGAGSNERGQLGLGDNIEYSSLEEIEGTGKIVAISAGDEHSLFLDADGKVYATGNNEYGQLGLGDNVERSSPEEIEIEGAGKIVAISGGKFHSLFLDEDGKVYSTGNNEYGQLGLGDNVERSSPEEIEIEGAGKIVAISVGKFHSLFLDEDGKVYSTGNNGSGRLGLGDWVARSSPEEIEIEGAGKIVAISAGCEHSLFLDEDGKVYATGSNSYLQLGFGENIGVKNRCEKIAGLEKIIAISAGEEHSLFLDEDGEIFGVGNNSSGKLGVLEVDTEDLIETDIEDLIHEIAVEGMEPENMIIEEVSLNCSTENKITFSYTDYEWGDQIDESTFKYAFDKKCEMPMKPFDVYEGIYLTPNFNEEYKLRIYAEANWGPDINKVYTINVINAPNDPPKVELLDIEPNIVIDGASTYYLTEKGDVYVSGRNQYGQLGIGGTEDQDTVKQIPNLKDVKEIISNRDSTYYLTKTTGEVYVCGKNFYRQLGVESTETVYDKARWQDIPVVLIPKKINGLSGIKAIETSGSSTYYLTEDGEVWVSGANYYGQLGVESTGVKFDEWMWVDVPIVSLVKKINLLSDIKEIITNGDSTYYLTEDGEVWVSGANYYGQLGVESTGSVWDESMGVDVPIVSLVKKINLLSDIKEIITNGNSTYYLTKTTGEVWVSGRNQYGQLSVENDEGTNVTQVKQIKKSDGSPLSDIKEIITNGNSTYYLTNGGTVWISGYNDFGELGTGDTEGVYEVQQIKNENEELLSSIKEIICGVSDEGEWLYTYYLTEDGEVWVSGANYNGQLGVENTEIILDESMGVDVPIVSLVKKINLLSDIKEIISNGNSTYYLTNGGEVWVSGANYYGQLGVESTGITHDDIAVGVGVDVPIVSLVKKINLLSDIKEIISNGHSTYYITNTGTVYVSGRNNYGQLGFDTEVSVIPTVTLQPDIKLPHNTSYPRVNNLSIIDEALDEVELACYAFVSQTALTANKNQVPEELWVPFDIDVPAVFLSPNSNDTYYLYVKLVFKDAPDGEIVYRDNEIHEKIIGPFEVTGIKGDNDFYSYATGDLYATRESFVEFNLIFLPSQDLTLGNSTNMFEGLFVPGEDGKALFDIQIFDEADSKIVSENSTYLKGNISNIYKNGIEIEDKDNFVFTKRDIGGENDNVYQIRVRMDGSKLTKKDNALGHYTLKINELNGISNDGMNTKVSLMSHPFAPMNVFITDFINLT